MLGDAVTIATRGPACRPEGESRRTVGLMIAEYDVSFLQVLARMLVPDYSAAHVFSDHLVGAKNRCLAGQRERWAL
jgi:hypothetical protein